MTGSTEMNRPSAGSYSRAPSWVSPVSALVVPPTKPWLPAGQAAGAPRGLPNEIHPPRGDRERDGVDRDRRRAVVVGDGPREAGCARYACRRRRSSGCPSRRRSPCRGAARRRRRRASPSPGRGAAARAVGVVDVRGHPAAGGDRGQRPSSFQVRVCGPAGPGRLAVLPAGVVGERRGGRSGGRPRSARAAGRRRRRRRDMRRSGRRRRRRRGPYGLAAPVAGRVVAVLVPVGRGPADGGGRRRGRRRRRRPRSTPT